ncbi:transmembrane protein 14C-like isoform X2 [Narcine bancroftii]|uniref:transmembrane protein 14C-like isoform X2 n=1 Tax=Narcine bancroftii TaxID=1343680 RepID=UPI0038310A08
MRALSPVRPASLAHAQTNAERHGGGLVGVWLCGFGGFGRSAGLCQSRVPSLAAGLLFGSAAGIGAYQITQNPQNIWLSLIVSGALTGIMGMRFYNSRKFMPAGLVAGLSILMLGRLGKRLLDKPHEP